jgi:hypothetical protein
MDPHSLDSAERPPIPEIVSQHDEEADRKEGEKE